MIRKSAGFTPRNRNVTISNGNAAKLPNRFHHSLAVSPVVAALWTARFAATATVMQNLVSRRLRAAIAPSDDAAQPF
jgi:hypothetical protein